MSKEDVLCFYDTDAVIERETELFCKKNGNTLEEVADTISALFKKWVEQEAEKIGHDLDDANKIEDRIAYCIEESDGQIWLCFKMLNVNNLWKILGTEEFGEP